MNIPNHQGPYNIFDPPVDNNPLPLWVLMHNPYPNVQAHPDFAAFSQMFVRELIHFMCRMLTNSKPVNTKVYWITEDGSVMRGKFKGFCLSTVRLCYYLSDYYFNSNTISGWSSSSYS